MPTLSDPATLISAIDTIMRPRRVRYRPLPCRHCHGTEMVDVEDGAPWITRRERCERCASTDGAEPCRECGEAAHVVALRLGEEKPVVLCHDCYEFDRERNYVVELLQAPEVMP